MNVEQQVLAGITVLAVLAVVVTVQCSYSRWMCNYLLHCTVLYCDVLRCTVMYCTTVKKP